MTGPQPPQLGGLASRVGRLFLALLVVGGVILGPVGCRPIPPGRAGRSGLEVSEKRIAARPPSVFRPVARGGLGSLALMMPEGAGVPVASLVWGGPISARRLAARYADGRFVVFRPDRGPDPISEGRADRPLASLEFVADDRVVTGDDEGLTLWDVTSRVAHPLGHWRCGAVAALAADPAGEGDLLAGLADGRILRYRPRGDSDLGEPIVEFRQTGPAVGVVALSFADGGASVLAARADGRVAKLRRDLGGAPLELGSARAVAATSGAPGLARLVSGPAVVVGDPQGASPTWRFCLPGAASGLAFVGGGSALVVAGEGRFLILNIRHGPPPPAGVRVLAAARGPTAVAADPADPAGRRLAVADTTGRVEVLDVATLFDRAGPWPLDDAAELAFRPHLRFYRPRPGSPGLDVPADLERRIEEARARLDRGELSGLSGLLRDLDVDPALDRLGAAEVAAMTAAVRQAEGWPAPRVLSLLRQAAESFRRQGRADREADLRFWLGMALAPPLDGPAAAPESSRPAEALDQFRHAARLYRAAGPTTLRQAWLCDALQAWVLLALGDVRGAGLAYGPVAEASHSDPVLGQSVELYRIAAALAAARGDWETAAEADRRLLDRLEPGDRPTLARRASLARLGALAALGRWDEAARLVEAPDPADPEWSLRRATAYLRAGLPVAPASSLAAEAIRDHVRGRLLVAEAQGFPETTARSRWEQAREALARAAEGYRQSGREDLATEADLERAEVLERLGRTAEALPVYAAVARRLDPSRLGREDGPLFWALSRPERGLARCQLALGHPAHVAAALDRTNLLRWSTRAGLGLVRTSPLSLPAEARPDLDALRTARLQAEHPPEETEDPGADPPTDPVAGLEAALVKRFPPPASEAEPTQALDLLSLGLAESEAVILYGVAGPDRLVGVVLRGDRPAEARALPVSREALRRAVWAWRAALGDGGRGLTITEPPGPDGLIGLVPEPDPPAVDPPHPTSEPSLDEYLEDVLIRPFDASLLGVTRLTIIPDDALGVLPFEAIGRGRRLGERFAISYAPSASILSQLRRSAPVPENRSGGVLILSPFGSAATHSALTPLADLYRSSGRRPELVLGSAARPSLLIEATARPLDVLHLTAPATLDPTRSPAADVEIRLSPGDLPPRSDGRLTASDLLRFPPRVRVAFLALGDPRDRSTVTGPGLLDLARSWLASGTPSVVLTLWDPPADSSPAFFAEFHRSLASGSPPSLALDRARQSVSQTPRFRDPVHWAGYVLYGRD